MMNCVNGNGGRWRKKGYGGGMKVLIVVLLHVT